MQPFFRNRFVAAAALAVCACLSAAATNAAQETGSSGWYVGAGLGINKMSSLEQAGWNRDSVCYPDDDCAHVGGVPQGYRWYYDLDAADGAAFEISLGRAFAALRLELSFTQRNNDLKQAFAGITYLDGSLRRSAENSNYESRSSAGVDDLTTRTISLNAYYDFLSPGSRFVPYLGLGAGVSFLKLSGLYFQSWYSCKNPAADCDRPERYNGHQDESLSDRVFSAHLHAGLDYRLNEKMRVGVKLSYAMMDDMADVRGEYLQHAAPGISNFTTISGMNHWSAMFAMNYFFGK